MPAELGNRLLWIKQRIRAPSGTAPLERFPDSYTHRYNVRQFPFPCSEGRP